jgi:hypothetical protein
MTISELKIELFAAGSYWLLFWHWGYCNSNLHEEIDKKQLD